MRLYVRNLAADSVAVAIPVEHNPVEHNPVEHNLVALVQVQEQSSRKMA